MPENVTRFQPIENVKKPLISWTYIDIMPSRLPTFFHEEPSMKAQAVSYRTSGEVVSALLRGDAAFEILSWAETRHLEGMPAQPLYEQRTPAPQDQPGTASPSIE